MKRWHSSLTNSMPWFIYRFTVRYGTKRFLRNLVVTLPIRIQYARLKSRLEATGSPCTGNLVAAATPRAAPASRSYGDPCGSHPRLKVLVVTEKWQGGNQQSEPPDVRFTIWDSLEESGLADQEHIYVDEYFHQSGRPADLSILERCLAFKPDCLLSTVNGAGGAHLIPKHETLNLVRKMGIRVIAWFTDVVHPFATPRPFRRLGNAPEGDYPFADLYLLQDTSIAHLKKTKKPDSYLCLPTPKDGRIYRLSESARDIDISFVGNIPSAPARLEAIQTLEDHGIRVYTRDSFNLEKNFGKGHYLSLADYVNVLQRSKMVLNFPFDVFCGKTIQQLKGRGFEAARCGAMLLEMESPETRAWLEPFVDYVPYTSPGDLVEKASYYLLHETERAAIARNGHKKVQERYNSKEYWKAVFGKIGLYSEPRTDLA